MASQTTQELALARLDDAIGRVCSVPEACARDPGRDFTRSRKLPLPKLVRLMVTWGGDTIPVELNDAFGWDGGAPTASAFCQQRAKLRDDVMPRVNEAFLGMWGHVPFGDGYRLLGVDGTSVALPGSDDPRTRVRSNQGSAERNEAHPSILYDISRRTFEDMVWQGAKEQDEPGVEFRREARLVGEPEREGREGEGAGREEAVEVEREARPLRDLEVVVGLAAVLDVVADAEVVVALGVGARIEGEADEVPAEVPERPLLLVAQAHRGVGGAHAEVGERVGLGERLFPVLARRLVVGAEGFVDVAGDVEERSVGERPLGVAVRGERMAPFELEVERGRAGGREQQGGEEESFHGRRV